MIEIYKKNDGVRIQLEEKKEGKTLLELLQEHCIYIEAPCEGKGNCGRCRVKVVRGAAEPTEKERRLLSEAELEHGIRLACATRPDGDCSIELCFSDGEAITSLTGGTGKATPAHEDLKYSYETEKSASGAGREGTAFGPEKSASGAGREETTSGTKKPASGKGDAVYGIAVDIGTTTLAAALVDLKSGDRRAVAASVNHQRAYGADVISRIQAANEGKGALLRECICTDVKNLMEELTGGADIRREQVKKVVIAANTTMCHLLRGLPCEGLGAAPFIPADITLWEGTIKELLGTEAWCGQAVILPGISAFVGADIVAGIYSSGMDRQEEPCLLLDIGTNGEMVLGNQEGFLVTSAAAGPVFEGGNISCGVPGIPGAVSHVTLYKKRDMGRLPGTEQCARTLAETETKQCSGTLTEPGAEEYLGMVTESGAEDMAAVYESSYETIEGRPPVGICGTGVIDVTSELVRNGLVDENGTLAEPWFEGGFPVAGDGVRFTQSDIREIQMGKSAIRAGIETLLSEYRKAEADRRKTGQVQTECSSRQCQVEDLEPDRPELQIYLAGGFGYYMDVEKAVRIGLFPASFSGQVKPVGNSALEGAVQFLLAQEEDAKGRLRWIVSHAKEINLAMHPKFNDLYMEHMFFET